VHPFWLSNEEKWPWLELSMEGQPWPELELQAQSWESLPERKGARGGRGWGVPGCCRKGEGL
jgi:hypothetical protein